MWVTVQIMTTEDMGTGRSPATGALTMPQTRSAMRILTTAASLILLLEDTRGTTTTAQVNQWCVVFVLDLAREKIGDASSQSQLEECSCLGMFFLQIECTIPFQNGLTLSGAHSSLECSGSLVSPCIHTHKICDRILENQPVSEKNECICLR